MARYRVALIGLGRIASTIDDEVQGYPSILLPYAHMADYREMLDREKPDVVSVCTSARPRPGIVADCARAGVRAILAEKPIAFSLAEADAMVELCREHGVRLAVN